MQDFFHQQYQSILTDNTLDLKQPKLKVVRMGHELVLYSKGKAIWNPRKIERGDWKNFWRLFFLWRYFLPRERTAYLAMIFKSPSLQWGGLGGHPFPTDVYHYRSPDKTKTYLTRVKIFVPDRNLLGVFLGGIFVESTVEMFPSFPLPTGKRQLTIALRIQTLP